MSRLSWLVFVLAFVALVAVYIGIEGGAAVTHDPAYIQRLDAWWLEHDSSDRAQACHLADRFGVEYTAEVLAMQWHDDQDHYVMALQRHCA